MPDTSLSYDPLVPYPLRSPSPKQGKGFKRRTGQGNLKSSDRAEMNGVKET